jgi:hypothetical protein
MRRSRRLVISLVATIANYEYGYFWYLYQDGTIEHEVKLSGIVSNGALAPGEQPEHGVLVAPTPTTSSTPTSRRARSSGTSARPSATSSSTPTASSCGRPGSRPDGRRSGCPSGSGSST